ncbi:MAG: class I SAM-dependent DNA methyltransferase [Candidatus Kryptoniota bacterium]
MPPYTESAAIYDHMMREVDYKSWGKYIIMLMAHAGVDTHRPKIKGRRLCELACGTGNLSLVLCKFGYDVTGVDISKRMLLQAQSKLQDVGHFGKYSARFVSHDMSSYRSSQKFDAMVCVYDSINYLSDRSEVEKFLGNAFSNLNSGGVLIFDASLESNSLNDPTLFVQHGRCGRIHYQRHSLYDRKTKTHTTQIRIKRDGRLFEEVHREHVFSLDTLRKLSAGKGFIERFAAGDFTMLEADSSSERVHFVLVKP